MKTAVVVGGGITGLSAIYYLQKMKEEKGLDLKLVLVEQNKDLGGKISTVKNDGFTIETGADSIVARNEGVMPLIEELGLEDEMVYNTTGISYIYTNNELHAIPADTIFGIPMSVEALFNSTLVSEKGKKEALKDLETKNEHFTKESSIGEFLEVFLGKELVEKQIAPVLSGVYSGKLDKLTIASTLPYLLDYKNKYGSIIKGLEENKEKFKSSSKGKFVSFENGLSTLIDKLEEKANDALVLKGAKTSSITKSNDKYELSFENHETLEADYVVLATPHNVAQKLLSDETVDEDFNRFKNSSLISIYLGFDIPDDELPADGTGFIVSENTDVKCDACTWTSRKWSHTSKNSNLLVRLFYKSSNSNYESLKELNEGELAQVALSDIEKSLKIEGKPRSIEVTNWKDMMPNYNLGHSEAIESLNEKLAADYPDIYLAGASYYGVGIGACIVNGKETAEKIANQLK
ncbi:protoporphyrinogen oxidase [Pseudalkalibacillus caeni]|uniref:Coproporphyrinogen III oxidase n=1 Tax=Exobacillus caeni TaxID=2574798 RepID=A0A5R9F0B3_9BACL|nr:protoporphyrinogen oxidase [Pseudalkalibacillus caeni]TLS37052.1 protoporphyrinogen oxidase [Pseudalkalibacillus caeni]